MVGKVDDGVLLPLLPCDGCMNMIGVPAVDDGVLPVVRGNIGVGAPCDGAAGVPVVESKEVRTVNGGNARLPPIADVAEAGVLPADGVVPSDDGVDDAVLLSLDVERVNTAAAICSALGRITNNGAFPAVVALGVLPAVVTVALLLPVRTVMGGVKMTGVAGADGAGVPPVVAIGMGRKSSILP